jgi:hypothetical protein
MFFFAFGTGDGLLSVIAGLAILIGEREFQTLKFFLMFPMQSSM